MARIYKTISFSEGIKLPFEKFLKEFEPHLKDLSEVEKKQAYKVATNGNISTTVKKSTKTKLSKGK